MISIIVPLFNEAENVAELVAEVTSTMNSAGLAYELITIDDGSRDNTVELLREIQKTHPKLRIIELRRNFGQTAALAAGFEHACGEVIVPLDGDLQNDPADIPALVAKLDEGYDVVSGWRRHRKDKLLTRKIPSWVANWLISRITKMPLHDYGCSLKAYRKEVVTHINLYGEMHRFIPAVARSYGAWVTEMEVNHRPRLHGETKYGLGRVVKVVLDLVTVKFLGSFSTKPLHIFGGIGFLSFLLAIVCGVIVLCQKYVLSNSLPMNRNPLLVVGAMLGMMSVQFLLMGLLAEMLARTYHESQKKPTYVIRRIIEPADEKGQDGSAEKVAEND